MNRLLKAEIGENLRLWYDKNDKYIGQRIAEGKYETYETKLILCLINENSVVVDVGANIGYYTLLMAKKAKRVYAFEPEGRNFEILKKNIIENNLRNVVLVKAAVGEKKGFVDLLISAENFGDHTVLTGIDNNRKIERVKLVSLDDYLKKEKCIDLLKIDTQGFEPLVIGGSKKMISKFKPSIFLEYFPGRYKEMGVNGEEMLATLKSSYKSIYAIDDYLRICPTADDSVIGRYCRRVQGYVDLWMTTDKLASGLKNRFWRDLRWKKLLKTMLGKSDVSYFGGDEQ